MRQRACLATVCMMSHHKYSRQTHTLSHGSHTTLNRGDEDSTHNGQLQNTRTNQLRPSHKKSKVFRQIILTHQTFRYTRSPKTPPRPSIQFLKTPPQTYYPQNMMSKMHKTTARTELESHVAPAQYPTSCSPHHRAPQKPPTPSPSPMRGISRSTTPLSPASSTFPAAARYSGSQWGCHMHDAADKVQRMCRWKRYSAPARMHHTRAPKTRRGYKRRHPRPHRNSLPPQSS